MYVTGVVLVSLTSPLLAQSLFLMTSLTGLFNLFAELLGVVFCLRGVVSDQPTD